MRIHVDFTDVVRHAYLNNTITGIQRVQLEVARELAAADPTARVFSHFVGHYHDLTELVRATRERPASDLYLALRRLYGRPFSGGLVHRGVGDTSANALMQAKLLRALLSSRSRRSIPRFGPDDLLYIGGAFWAYRGCLDLYEEASRAGATLVALVHDVIPVTFPHFTDGGARPFFERLLRLPLHVLADSAFTRSDLVRAQALIPGARPFRSMSVAPLAHEFRGAARNQAAGEAPSERLARLGRAGPFVLSVGTIEIRKNHRALLDLWSRLAGELEARLPKLIVAGKRGWMAEPALRALDRADAQSPFALVEAPTDRELAWLYAKASFTVFPSFAEGWGLPVGESLWFGKPCVASNASSLPEVGGDLCLYADPHRFGSFAGPVSKLVEDKDFFDASVARIKSSRLRTWSQAAKEIVGAISARAEGR
jgi:glycosyltransferase involved in cell wall biosynthesis